MEFKKKDFIEKGLWLAVWGLMLFIASKTKISFFVGDQKAHIMALGAILPLAGCFSSRKASILFFMVAWLCTHLHSLIPLTAGIPTLLATLSWNSSKDEDKQLAFALHVVLPILCMALFIASSSGSIGWPVALYWLIPIALHFFNRHSYLKMALQSTFVAHAVGCVMWAYLTPISGQMWLALLPVMAIERLITPFVSLTAIYLLNGIFSFFALANDKAYNRLAKAI